MAEPVSSSDSPRSTSAMRWRHLMEKETLCTICKRGIRHGSRQQAWPIGRYIVTCSRIYIYVNVYCGCRNPGHLEKVFLLHAPILSLNEAFLGIGARALVARQTECFNLVSTLEEFFFFLEHYSTLYKSSILWIFFFFLFLTVLNFLQNSR